MLMFDINDSFIFKDSPIKNDLAENSFFIQNKEEPLNEFKKS